MQTPPPPSDSRDVPCPVCDAEDRELFFEVRGYRIARCRRCGFRYVNPRPSEAALLDLYAGRGANPFTDPSFEAFEDLNAGGVVNLSCHIPLKRSKGKHARSGQIRMGMMM